MPNRRALCVGVDEYAGGGVLNGAVSDARGWKSLLEETFGYSPDDVTLLIDKHATARAIRGALSSLVEGAAKGDAFVVSLAGHGSVVQTEGPDPATQHVFCPFDVAEEQIAFQEVLALGQQLPKGASLSIVVDTGFSGTVVRAAWAETGLPGAGGSDVRVRWLSPSVYLTQGSGWRAGAGAAPEPLKAAPGVALLMACSESGYAYEGFIKGAYRGAFSWHATQILRAGGPATTFRELEARLRGALPSVSWPQTPKIATATKDRAKPVFFG